MEADVSEAQQDRLLIQKIQSGNKRAFDILVIKYQHRIMVLIGKYVHDLAEVQDIAQEVFIKAYRALSDFRGESAFYTWLYRIAVNTAKNHIITAGRRPPSQDLAIDEAEQYVDAWGLRENATPDRILQKERLENMIFSTVRSLPEELREAFLLREREGFSYEQIASIMRCPIGTVRSRIFRAREAVDKAITSPLDFTVVVEAAQYEEA